nr:MBOAT family protein [Lachnospiraceae bacterium]
IAWLVDSSRGETKGYDLLDYAVFIFFFPKLIMGPIILHEEFIPQLNDEKRFRPDFENLSKGMIWFTVGLSKVLLIEPMFTFGVQYGFTMLSGLSLAEAWFCSIAFTLQLYFDFSGYCDMAAGMAMMMNLELPMNFNSPYKAVSVGDFWKRWHISLTRFLRKYIYFPLGGNRKGTFRTYLNIMIIFLISGFWHGANWTFIVWGAIHGVIMIIERLTGITARDKLAADSSKSDGLSKAGVSGNSSDGKKMSVHLITFIRRIITFIIVDIAWVFFRADSLSDAVAFIKQMFIPDNIMPNAQFYNSFGLNDFAFATRHLNIFVPMLFAAALAMVFFGKNIYETKYKPTLMTAIVTAVLFLASFVCLGNAADFIYFKF